MPSDPAAYLVDDDSAIRDSLSLWLGMRGIRCLAYESAESFLDAVEPDWRGCVLIDLQLEGINGLQLQERLAERGITMPVIFVTGHGDVAAVRDALVATAMATDAEAAQRQAQAALLASRLRRLTQREREVMTQVVAGRHNREIAADLGISPRTVEVYKSRLMDKLDVRRVADLVKLALEARADTRP